jgi:hypothetical protein
MEHPLLIRFIIRSLFGIQLSHPFSCIYKERKGLEREGERDGGLNLVEERDSTYCS